MLSLAPLSGLQAAIKRRNSKAARRDSISIEHSNLALPGTIRRFSSSETLNSLAPAATPSVAVVSRISSFSRKIRKISVGSGNPVQTELVDTCNVLDLHIAQIKRKLAEFREEDVEISERVEELTITLGDLCQDYHIPYTPLVTHWCVPYKAETVNKSHDELEQEQDEEEFQKFCQNHTYLMNTTSASHHLGYSTLPLPPNKGGQRKAITTSGPHPKRSQSYEGHHLFDNARLSIRHNSTPADSERTGPYHRKLQFTVSHGSYRPRPLSYQDISYDENDFEELSCP